MSVPREQLIALIGQRWPSAKTIEVEAGSYACPEPEWIAGQFSDDLKEFLDWNNLAPRDEQFVCRHLAMTALMFAKLVWYDTRKQPDDLGLGLITYHPRNASAFDDHKILVGLHRFPNTETYLACYGPPVLIVGQPIGRFQRLTLSEEEDQTVSKVQFI